MGQLIKILKEIKAKPNLGINWENAKWVRVIDRYDKVGYYIDLGRYLLKASSDYEAILVSKKRFKNSTKTISDIDNDSDIEKYKELFDQGKYKIIN